MNYTKNDNNIKNDPNECAKEVENQKYILNLLLSINEVRVQTAKMAKGLLKFNFK